MADRCYPGRGPSQRCSSHGDFDTHELRATVGIIALTATLTTAVTIGGAIAQQGAGSGPAVPAVVLPGTNHVVAPRAWNQSLRSLQDSIGDWLAFEFDLPRAPVQATVSFASAGRMSRLRFRDVPSDDWSTDKSDVLAVYDDDSRTIYLPDGWTGGTAAELSVLVHEMIHHLQNVRGLKFACPEEREKMAYDAQERWLQLFGGSLEADFELDPFTLLVRTTCHY